MWSKEIVDRFMSYVNKDSEYFECWDWIGYKDELGRGQFHVWKEKTYRVHRFMWELVNGKIPEGMCVCHECDNPMCVNPDHLFLGTQQDNMNDKKLKGREARGEQIKQSKLTEDDVREIRELYAIGYYQGYLAGKFGISQGHVSEIVNYINWRHVK